jgi:hypothetical protein
MQGSSPWVFLFLLLLFSCCRALKKQSFMTSDKRSLLVLLPQVVKLSRLKGTLEGRDSAVCGGLSSFIVSSLTFSTYVCHPRGILSTHWACRVFSGPWGIVVVRASWPEHPTLIKKKSRLKGLKTNNNAWMHDWLFSVRLFYIKHKKLYCFLCFFYFLMSVMMSLVSVLFGFFNLVILYFFN